MQLPVRLVWPLLWACLLSVPAAALAESLSGWHACFKAGRYLENAPPPSGRHYAPSREIDILHQKLEVTPDFEKRSVAGKIQIDFQPIAKPLELLKLDAVRLSVETVQSSHPIRAWDNTGEFLRIHFQEPIAAGSSNWIRIVYQADEPDKGLYFRTPAQGYKPGDTHLWTQGEMHEARHWYPSYDYPNEKFTTEMVCHVRAGMVALSNGRLVSQSTNKATGLVAWHWLQDKPHVNYLVTLCAGYFEKIEDVKGGVALAFWTPPSQIAFARNSFAGTRAMLDFFEKETGVPYPWARYDQVVVDDFTWGGMENTTQTTLTDKTLFPDELAGTRTSVPLVAHELAHQWFGNYVTTKDWSHIWLNEGFATYYEALYTEHAKGRDEFLYEMLGNARSILSQPNDILPVVYRAYKSPEEQFGYRAYPKGAWILHMLRTQLGPDLYRKCVHEHLRRHALDNATTEDFVGIVEELSGRDWDQFFDQYAYHAHHPELKAAYDWDEKSRLAKLSIQQTQKLGPTVLLFSVPLKVRFKADGQLHDMIAHVSRGTEDFYFSLPARPEWVRIDPEFGWLAQVEFSPPAEMIHKQLVEKGDVIGRVFAVENLGRRQDASSVEKLRQTLQNDSFWGVRLEAAKALTQIHTETARTALIQSIRQPDARVRQEVVRGIASFYSGDTPETLRRALENESNPDVQAVALRALAAYPHIHTREILTEKLKSKSYKHRLAQAAIETIRAQRDPFFIEPLMQVLRERESDFTSAAFAEGLQTLARLAADLESKGPSREFILPHLRHPKQVVQLAAIRALAELGDPQALPAINTFVMEMKDSPRRKAAEEAMRDLRSRRRPAEEVNTLRQEVLDLQKQQRELQQKFDELRKRTEALTTPGASKPAPARNKPSSNRGSR